MKLLIYTKVRTMNFRKKWNLVKDNFNQNRKTYIKNGIILIFLFPILQFTLFWITFYITMGGLSTWPKFMIRFVTGMYLLINPDLPNFPLFIIFDLTVSLFISIVATYCYLNLNRRK